MDKSGNIKTDLMSRRMAMKRQLDATPADPAKNTASKNATAKNEHRRSPRRSALPRPSFNATRSNPISRKHRSPNFAEKRLAKFRQELAQNVQRKTSSGKGRAAVNSAVTTSPSKAARNVPIAKPNPNTTDIKKDSKDLNSNKTEDLDEDEPMDWSPISEEEVVNRVQNFRSCSQALFSNSARTFSSMLGHQQQFHVEKHLHYAVVDTNVFLSNLPALRQVCSEHANIVIVVPWMVLQELDAIKDRKGALESASRNAVRFINEQLTNGQNRLKGQPSTVANSSTFPEDTPDDSILACCLMLMERDCRVALFSNDINLRNKALVHSLPAYGNAGFAQFASEVRLHLVPRIKQELLEVCASTVAVEVRRLDGDAAAVASLTTLEQVLQCMQQHWAEVFAAVMRPETKTVIDRLAGFCERFQVAGFKFDETIWMDFLKCIFTLCGHLKATYPSLTSLVSEKIQCLQAIVSDS